MNLNDLTIAHSYPFLVSNINTFIGQSCPFAQMNIQFIELKAGEEARSRFRESDMFETA